MTAVQPPSAVTPFADWPAVDLSEVLAVADLQTRFDTKYVVDVGVLEDIAALLDGRAKVLDVGGSRLVDYRTIYFDTPDLLTYRTHVQRRRRRYKVRTRTYLGQGATMLEVKTKDRAGRTVKHRTDHPGERPGEMPASAVAFVERALEEAYGFALPRPMHVGATTRYRRITLLAPDAGERLTADFDLAVYRHGRVAVLGQEHVLLEVKAPAPAGHIERLLRRLRIRPLSVSKYGLAVTVLEPHQPGNRWRPAIRRLRPHRVPELMGKLSGGSVRLRELAAAGQVDAVPRRVEEAPNP